MNLDGKSITPVSVHIGDDATVICHTYKWATPILVIGAGSASVSISVKGREDMPAPALAFARALARNAERFAAECERLHVLHGQASDESRAAASAQVAAGGTP
jgi:precorrin-6B methylase 2